jgi:hypothetical protein
MVIIKPIKEREGYEKESCLAVLGLYRSDGSGVDILCPGGDTVTHPNADTHTNRVANTQANRHSYALG